MGRTSLIQQHQNCIYSQKNLKTKLAVGSWISHSAHVGVRGLQSFVDVVLLAHMRSCSWFSLVGVFALVAAGAFVVCALELGMGVICCGTGNGSERQEDARGRVSLCRQLQTLRLASCGYSPCRDAPRLRMECSQEASCEQR